MLFVVATQPDETIALTEAMHGHISFSSLRHRKAQCSFGNKPLCDIGREFLGEVAT